MRPKTLTANFPNETMSDKRTDNYYWLQDAKRCACGHSPIGAESKPSLTSCLSQEPSSSSADMIDNSACVLCLLCF